MKIKGGKEKKQLKLEKLKKNTHQDVSDFTYRNIYIF